MISLQRLSRLTRKTSTNNDCLRAEAERNSAIIKEVGLGGAVMLDFLKGTPIGSRIFVDNYFGSFTLMKKMSDLGYGITCTLRPGHTLKCPLPAEKKMKQKPRGYYESFVSDDERCAIVAWKDRKRVLLGSNCMDENPMTLLKRWNKEGRRHEQIPAPQIVVYYHKYMGGVDKLDIMLALHPIPFRSKKMVHSNCVANI